MADPEVTSREAALERLGLKATATSTQVKMAYRRLVKIYHPDANPHNVADARNTFMHVQKAYEFLSRKNFASLHGGPSGDASGAGSSFASNAARSAAAAGAYDPFKDACAKQPTYFTEPGRMDPAKLAKMPKPKFASRVPIFSFGAVVVLLAITAPRLLHVDDSGTSNPNLRSRK